MIEQARIPGRSIGTLASALDDFFTARGLVLPTDYAQQLATARRKHRVDAVPAPLRTAVAAFEESMLGERERSRRAGTRPRADNTIESRLGEIRSLAKHLSCNGINDWALVDKAAIEDYLADHTAGRSKRLASCRQFFLFARRNKLILIDPTAGLRAPKGSGFIGRTEPRNRQRELFARWTTLPQVHPHEALAGLLALIHGVSPQELKHLLIDDVDHPRATIRLGRRPNPTPLDPATWTALLTCLAHRTALETGNPHVIVTRLTRSRQSPASPAYLYHLLDPAGTTMATLRSSRLLALANTHDPNLVATAYGMSAEGVLAYFADRIDPTLLADL